MDVKFQIAIAIVTKNRVLKLNRCLESIEKQTEKPLEILVIDNDIKKSAYPIYKKFVKRVPISYFSEERPGVPFARNIALVKSKANYLGFVDDDCILDNKWVATTLGAIKKNKRAVYFCGNTYLFNKNNILADAQYLHDRYWFMKKIKSNEKITAGNFDTKNICINKNRIISKRIEFDPNCSMHGYDSADLDFGIQLERFHFKGIYVKEMKLFHEETSTLKRFTERAYFRGMIAGYISRKWNLKGSLVVLPKVSILRWFIQMVKNNFKDFYKYTNSIKTSRFYKTLIVFSIILGEAIYLKGYSDYKS